MCMRKLWGLSSFFWPALAPYHEKINVGKKIGRCAGVVCMTGGEVSCRNGISSGLPVSLALLLIVGVEIRILTLTLSN